MYSWTLVATIVWQLRSSAWYTKTVKNSCCSSLHAVNVSLLVLFLVSIFIDYLFQQFIVLQFFLYCGSPRNTPLQLSTCHVLLEIVEGRLILLNDCSEICNLRVYNSNIIPSNKVASTYQLVPPVQLVDLHSAFVSAVCCWYWIINHSSVNIEMLLLLEGWRKNR